MKKILLYLVGFIIIFFIIPVLLTISPKKENVEETISNIDENLEILNWPQKLILVKLSKFDIIYLHVYFFKTFISY